MSVSTKTDRKFVRAPDHTSWPACASWPSAHYAWAVTPTSPPPCAGPPATHVGWPGGIAPPGSHRSRREGLPSPGSCHLDHQNETLHAHRSEERRVGKERRS